MQINRCEFWDCEKILKCTENRPLCTPCAPPVHPEISNIFDNKLVQGILGLGELGVPGADLPTGIEFGLSILELIDTFGRDFIGDTIEHNTDLSAYLFDKVIYKEPDEDVAILKSATTYKGDKYFWQDSLEVEKVVERVFY